MSGIILCCNLQSSIFDWVNMGNVEDSSQEIQSSQPKSDVTSDEAEK